MGKIGWEKWRNPVNPEKDPSLELKKKTLMEALEEELGEMESFKNDYPMIVTDMGIIPILESNDPEKVFDFWVGYTDFDITNKVATKIKNVQGVEILDIWTRYRFRICVGRMFRSEDVKKDIQNLFL